MKFPRIGHLYKFYAYNKNSLSVLKNRKVWFPKPDSLNDPFDGKIPFDNSITLRELEKFLPRYKNFKGLSKQELEEEISKIKNSRGQLDDEFKEHYRKNIGVKPTLLTGLMVYDIHPLFFKLLPAA